MAEGTVRNGAGRSGRNGSGGTGEEVEQKEKGTEGVGWVFPGVQLNSPLRVRAGSFHISDHGFGIHVTTLLDRINAMVHANPSAAVERVGPPKLPRRRWLRRGEIRAKTAEPPLLTN